MAKKDRTEKPQRELTRRQLSHRQRQKRRERIIFGAGIFIIAAVVLIVLVGWFMSSYQPYHRTVIKVNDTKYNAGYYIERLRVAERSKPTEYAQIAAADYLPAIADIMVKNIEQNELITLGASQLGISVSDDEVKNILKENNTPVNAVTRDLARVQLLLDRLTKEHFDSQVPESSPQVHIMSMLLESESQVSEIRARLQGSDNFTVLAPEFSLDPYSKANKGDIGWHPQEVLAVIFNSSVPGEYAFGSEAGVLSQPRFDEKITKPVGYWLLRVAEKIDTDIAQVQAILLGSEEEAQSVTSRLQAGEDFAALAQELSQYPKSKDNGGELGEVTKGTMSAAFDEYVFNPETKTGTLSEPVRDDTVQTTGGYWLIKVVEKASDRALDTTDRNYLLNLALSDWVSSLWLDTTNYAVDDSFLTADMKAWAIQQALKSPL